MAVSIGLVNGDVISCPDLDFKESIYKIDRLSSMDNKKWLKVKENMIVRIDNIAWISDENLQPLDDTLKGIQDWI